MKAKYIFFLIFYFCLTLNILFSNTYIDSLKTNLESMNTQEQIQALNKISFACWNKDPEEGIKFALRALELSKKNEDLRGEASAYKNIGVNHWARGSYEESIENHLKSLELNKKLNEEAAIASCYTNLALVYNQQGNFSKALEYQLKSVQIDEKNDNKEGLLHSCNNVGLIYSSLEDYEKALPYFQKSYDLQMELNLTDNIAYTINNLGVMYDKMNQPEKALEYFNKALKIDEETGNVYGEANCLYNIARIQASLGNMEDAIKISEQSLKMRKAQNNPYYITQSTVSLGSIYIDAGNFDRGEELLQQAYVLAKEYGFAQEKSFALLHLFELHEQQNKYESALNFYKEYIQVRDSLFSEEKTNEINFLNAQHEITVKERENQILSADNKLQALEIEKQKNLKIFFAILTLLITILIILIFRQDRHKVRVVKELTANYKLIEQQKNELSVANTRLEELDASKNKFFSIIAHDLRNPLVAQLSGFRIFYKHLDSMSKKETQKIALEMKKNTTHVLELLENLLHWSRLQMGRVDFEPVKINVQTIIFHCFQILKMKAEQKEITLEHNLEQQQLIWADKNMITLVLNNLLTNAIKFFKPGSKVLVKGKLEEDFVKISVIDNGVGMKPEQLKNIFVLDKSSTTLGTQKEKGTGLGLILCKEFLQKNNGALEISSSLGKGTIVSFKLPAETSKKE